MGSNKYSTPGPDWTDVEAALRAIDGIHLGKTGVLISAEGIGGSGGLRIDIVTSFGAPVGTMAVDSVVSSSLWPCKDCTTLSAHVLGGLYAHDYAIGQAHEQKRLDDWKVPPGYNL